MRTPSPSAALKFSLQSGLPGKRGQPGGRFGGKPAAALQRFGVRPHNLAGIPEGVREASDLGGSKARRQVQRNPGRPLLGIRQPALSLSGDPSNRGVPAHSLRRALNQAGPPRSTRGRWQSAPIYKMGVLGCQAGRPSGLQKGSTSKPSWWRPLSALTETRMSSSRSRRSRWAL